MFLSAAFFAASIISALGFGANSAVAETLAGPYRGTVERVVDGDTLGVRVTVWLDQNLRVLVRLRGIDAPELRGRCQSEKDQAKAARAALTELVAGDTVLLTNIEGDKYFGRVLADVVASASGDVGLALMAGGHARPYDGAARGGWCAISVSNGTEPGKVTQVGRAE